MRSVIYFPYIRVPQSQWFTQVLLYWDQVVSIVPESLEGSFELGPNMNQLMDLQLVKPLRPREYINNRYHFDEAFLEYINSPANPIRDNQRELRQMHYVDVHIEKLPPSVIEELSRKGLVRRIRDQWIELEAYTANQYMAYLASFLGRLPEINSTPITDNRSTFQSIDPIYLRAQANINAMRGVVLNDIFPSPEGLIAPESIVDFKSDHRNELERFRNRIETFLVHAASEPNDAIRSMQVDQFRRELSDEISVLKESMEQRNWGYISLGRFLAYAPGMAGIIGGAIAANPPAIVGGILSLANAVYRDYMYINEAEDLMRNPMAYAMLVGRLESRH
jgi:hypothetical protein